MFVRNFWVEVIIDGKAQVFQSGPKSKDGGIVIRVYQRNKGEIQKALTVEGRPKADGKTLQLLAFDETSQGSIHIQTER